MEPIRISNGSDENLVFALYSCSDFFQATTIARINIEPSEHGVFENLCDDSYMMHVYRPGPFGMISLLTRLSHAYGFPVRSGRTYGTNLIESNKQRELVVLRKVLTQRNTQEDSVVQEDSLVQAVSFPTSSTPDELELAAERRRIAMEKVNTINHKRYEIHKETFSLAVGVVMSAGTISSKQLQKLWESAAPLQADDAANIIAERLHRHCHTSEIEEDAPGAESQCCTIVDLLLAGADIRAEQIDMLADVSSRLRKETLTALLSRQLLLAYDSKGQTSLGEWGKKGERGESLPQKTSVTTPAVSTPGRIPPAPIARTPPPPPLPSGPPSESRPMSMAFNLQDAIKSGRKTLKASEAVGETHVQRPLARAEVGEGLHCASRPANPTMGAILAARGNLKSRGTTTVLASSGNSLEVTIAERRNSLKSIPRQSSLGAY